METAALSLLSLDLEPGTLQYSGQESGQHVPPGAHSPDLKIRTVARAGLTERTYILLVLASITQLQLLCPPRQGF